MEKCTYSSSSELKTSEANQQKMAAVQIKAVNSSTLSPFVRPSGQTDLFLRNFIRSVDDSIDPSNTKGSLANQQPNSYPMCHLGFFYIDNISSQNYFLTEKCSQFFSNKLTDKVKCKCVECKLILCFKISVKEKQSQRMASVYHKHAPLLTAELGLSACQSYL